MQRFFSAKMPGVKFVMNVLVFSLIGLLPVLLVYVMRAPGFASALMDGGPALSRFLRQVLTNGLPVIFIVNYVGFFLFAVLNTKDANGRDPASFILLDLVIRVALFLVLHAFIYVLSASWFGSFGGSRATALSVVAPTLARSALFENISGVYLYATLVSALPLYVTAAGKSAILRPFVDLFPRNMGAVSVALLAFLSAAVCLTAIAAVILRLQS
ncbi:hypothetical protein [uncultured Roseobacter sp.]|uniref:hypothetical protein n=1 Tax=uncultured Roseobacter sp. TaxID=114847 RepID=UPI0026371B49|nr:hypothetical protein [uncultured Roseobacter sp.]